MTHSEFKSIRLSLGLSQAALANGLNCTPRAVIYWEQGERKIPGSIACIMRLLASGRIQFEEIEELCN